MGGVIPLESSRLSLMSSRRVSASADSRRALIRLRALATLSAIAAACTVCELLKCRYRHGDRPLLVDFY